MNLISSYKTEFELLRKFIEEEEERKETEKVAKKLADIFTKGKKVLICGNGGSNCDAMHFIEEFTGRFRKERRALPAISISDPSHITCVANDYGFEYIFSKGVEAYGQEGDMFIGISTSGNSPNVIKAVEQAKAQGLITVGLLGKDGGKLRAIADVSIVVPNQKTYQIQELHLPIYHALCLQLEDKFFK